VRPSLCARLGMLAVCVFGCVEPPEGSPEELIRQGWADFRLQEYDRAIRMFQAAAKKAPAASDLRLHGLYAAAATWDLRRPGENRPLAKDLYTQVVEEAPDSDWAAWSLLALARQKHLAPVGEILDYAAIRAAYQNVIDRFPYHLAGEEAFLFQQATWLASLEDDEARKALEATKRFIATHPDSPFISPAYDLLASVYDTLEMGEEKLAALIKSFKTVEVDPTAFFDPQFIYWNIATTAEFDAGDLETARAYYERFIDECPRDQKHYGAILALERIDETEAKVRAELLAEGSEGRSPGGGGL